MENNPQEEKQAVKHKVTFFEKIASDEAGTAIPHTLDEMYELFKTLSSPHVAHDLSGYSDTQLNNYKAYEAPSFVFASLDKGRKTKESVLERTLLSIDIDQKYQNLITVDEIVSILEEHNVDSILYTTISHSDSFHRCRVIIDAGCNCDEVVHSKLVTWFARKLPDDCIVDDKSYSMAHPMVLPVAYAYIPPIVKRINGEALYDQYQNEIDGLELLKPITGERKSESNSHSMNDFISPKAKELFLQLVGYLHKPLIFRRTAAHSLRFARNTRDEHPLLYAMNNMRFVHDKKRGEQYALPYSQLNYEQSLNHSLEKRSDVIRDLLFWELNDNFQYAVFKENCGSGKSSALVALSYCDPLEQRRIFTFHTIDNRDAFAANAHNSIVICGNTDIVRTVVTDDNRFGLIRSELDNHYKRVGKLYASIDIALEGGTQAAKNIANKKLGETKGKRVGLYFSDALKKCVDKGYLSKDEVKDVLKRAKANNELINSDKHLIMTTQKFEHMASFATSDVFGDSIVYTDEVEIGMLTHIRSDLNIPVYANDTYGTAKKNDNLNHECLKSFKRCLLTVEDGIELELDKQGVSHQMISKPVKTYDPNLEIVLVPSTSNHNDGKRTKIAKAIEDVYGGNITVITDGEKESGFTVNHTSSKGSNNYSNQIIAVMGSFPSTDELATAMHCTGLSEDEAKVLIMSNKVNQSVGRNMGYRNKNDKGEPSKGNNHCLLIIPVTMAELNYQNVTSMVANTAKWISVDNTKKTDELLKQEFYFRDAIDAIADATKASNQKSSLKPMSSDEFIQSVKKYAIENNIRRPSVKEIKELLGLDTNLVNQYVDAHFEVRKCKYKSSYSSKRIILDNIFEEV